MVANIHKLIPKTSRPSLPVLLKLPPPSVPSCSWTAHRGPPIPILSTEVSVILLEKSHSDTFVEFVDACYKSKHGLLWMSACSHSYTSHFVPMCVLLLTRKGVRSGMLGALLDHNYRVDGITSSTMCFSMLYQLVTLSRENRETIQMAIEYICSYSKNWTSFDRKLELAVKYLIDGFCDRSTTFNAVVGILAVCYPKAQIHHGLRNKYIARKTSKLGGQMLQLPCFTDLSIFIINK